MIGLTSNNIPPKPEGFLSSGGFVWWYLDLRDPNGNGLVLIWAFGLPFLPNYASSAKIGEAPMPVDRPSINISIYTDHQLDFYLLQEYSPEDCEHGDDYWRFGQTVIKSQQKSNHYTLWASINCPVPSSSHPLIGEINYSGPLCQGDFIPEDTHHQWTPIVVASIGNIDLNCGEIQYKFEGRGYHDRNVSLLPLHELGIRNWWWGRIAFPEREVIFYSLRPNDSLNPIDMSLTINTDGHMLLRPQSPLSTQALTSSFYGLSWPKSLQFECPNGHSINVKLTKKVDDGPFYQRFFIHAESDHDGIGYGFAEHVCPDKVDQDWMRPLVKMRVHTLNKKNSFWLPLFSGPRKGRWKRLFSFNKGPSLLDKEQTSDR